MTELVLSGSRGPTRAHLSLVTPTTGNVNMDPVSRTNPTRLTPEEVSAIFTRNSTTTLLFSLDDGSPRTTRIRYRYTGSLVYVPATPALASLLSADVEPYVECDVSEVDGLACWRYVWARGTVTALQPTGASVERDEWREGIEQIRAVMPMLAHTEDLRFKNFGVLRITPLVLSGVVVRLDALDLLWTGDPLEPLEALQ